MVKLATLNSRAFAFSLSVIQLADDLPKKRSAWVIVASIIKLKASL
jgi:hypothetical protein